MPIVVISREQVKRAYLKSLLVLHPDKCVFHILTVTHELSRAVGSRSGLAVLAREVFEVHSN